MIIEVHQHTKNYLDLLFLAARGCYGLENITSETTKQKQSLIKKIISFGHESVLEHGIISIFIKGCSRSFLAQLTRHRIASFSVKSQHFVKHKEFKVKPIETNHKRANILYESTCDLIRDVYNKMIGEFNIPYYIAREILPNGCLTNIFMTTNFREWRHIIKIRQTDDNTPEMKEFAHIIKGMFQLIIPEVFNDL